MASRPRLLCAGCRVRTDSRAVSGKSQDQVSGAGPGPKDVQAGQTKIILKIFFRCEYWNNYLAQKCLHKLKPEAK